MSQDQDPGEQSHGDHVNRDDDHGHRDHDHGDQGLGEHEPGNHDQDDQDHGDHAHDHHHAPDLDEVGVAVATITSSRSLEDDDAGDAIEAAVTDAGHELVHRELIGDDHDQIQKIVKRLVDRRDADCVVTTGGTGVTPDDLTPEAVDPLFDKELPGFGELFRRLSYDEIGTRIVGTRAVAGVVDGVPVFCLPGSENAARLGIEEIILPEVAHLAGLARIEDEDEEEEAEETEGDGSSVDAAEQP
jgi:molybdenum cofactor biosynthesis protein B